MNADKAVLLIRVDKASLRFPECGQALHVAISMGSFSGCYRNTT
jgi:hypothetical protein